MILKHNTWFQYRHITNRQNTEDSDTIRSDTHSFWHRSWATVSGVYHYSPSQGVGHFSPSISSSSRMGLAPSVCLLCLLPPWGEGGSIERGATHGQEFRRGRMKPENAGWGLFTFHLDMTLVRWLEACFRHSWLMERTNAPCPCFASWPDTCWEWVGWPISVGTIRRTTLWLFSGCKKQSRWTHLVTIYIIISTSSKFKFKFLCKKGKTGFDRYQ